jgi:hypothetical protein
LLALRTGVVAMRSSIGRVDWRGVAGVRASHRDGGSCLTITPHMQSG